MRLMTFKVSYSNAYLNPRHLISCNTQYRRRTTLFLSSMPKLTFSFKKHVLYHSTQEQWNGIEKQAEWAPKTFNECSTYRIKFWQMQWAVRITTVNNSLRKLRKWMRIIRINVRRGRFPMLWYVSNEVMVVEQKEKERKREDTRKRMMIRQIWTKVQTVEVRELGLHKKWSHQEETWPLSLV